MADLAVPPSSDVVRTTANPNPRLLLLARAQIQTDEFRRVYADARDGNLDVESLADHLAVRLSAAWGGRDFGEAMEVARYLADEYFQLGDKPMVVSTETGRAMVLDAGDLWQPGLVPRESGNLAQPLPRLHPMREAALLEDLHERARESGFLARRAQATTDLVADAGDPRNLILTRAGRQQLTDQIARDLYPRFVEQVGREFRGCVKVAGSSEGHRFETVLTTEVRTSLHDRQSLSLRHDFMGRALLSAINGWCRSLAGALAAEGWRRNVHEAVTFGSLSSRLDGVAHWTSPDKLALGLLELTRGSVRVLVVPTALLVVGLSESAVSLEPDWTRIDVRRADYADMWMMSASMPVSVVVQDTLVRYLDVTDPPESSVQPEIVR